MTRLRISAHDLEIERGRYFNIPRPDRICKWCLASKNDKITESEKHFLFDCDLYLEYRNKLLKDLKNLINRNELRSGTSSDICIALTPRSIKHKLMKLISPHTTEHFDENDTFTRHFKRLPSSHSDFVTHNHIRSYISNTVCAYVNRCFEKRQKFVEKTSANSAVTVIDINILFCLIASFLTKIIYTTMFLIPRSF